MGVWGIASTSIGIVMIGIELIELVTLDSGQLTYSLTRIASWSGYRRQRVMHGLNKKQIKCIHTYIDTRHVMEEQSTVQT